MPSGRVGHEAALEEDALARRLNADQARQPQGGGARDEAFLAGRQVEVGAGLGDHAVHHAQELAAAADGERLDHRQPRLLDVVLELLVVALGHPVAAVDLVEQAELALEDELDERDLPVIEVRQVDAGIEDAAIRCTSGGRARRRAARRPRSASSSSTRSTPVSSASTAASSSALRNLGLVSVTTPSVVLALDDRRAEIDPARAAEFGEPLLCLPLRLEHGVHQVPAAALVGKDVGDEQPLIDLLAFLGESACSALAPRRSRRGSAGGPDRGRPPCRRDRPPAAAPCSRWSSCRTSRPRGGGKTPLARSRALPFSCWACWRASALRSGGAPSFCSPCPTASR